MSQPTSQLTRDNLSPGRLRRYLLVGALVVAVVVAGVGVANYAMNPMSYNRGYIADVARATTEGKNFATYDQSVNWRALRREQIAMMPSAPDIIVFGGSRWWEAHSELFGGKTVFNSWVSNDQAEDVMALAYLLERADRLPKTLILSLRFISFQPPEHRQAAEWQEWAPEYRKMAARLGVEPHPRHRTIPVKNWSSMFYAPGAFIRAQQLMAAPHSAHVTTDTEAPTLDILDADGSIRWSVKSTKRFIKKAVDKAVQAELKRVGNNAPQIDQSLVDAMWKTIDHLRAKGVQVILAQTPYHPDFYAEISKRPFGRTLDRLERLAAEASASHGVTTVGTYDPGQVGCTADQFIDHIHSKPGCLAKVIQQIPDLAPRTS